jgi:hypothetical protein
VPQLASSTSSSAPIRPRRRTRPASPGDTRQVRPRVTSPMSTATSTTTSAEPEPVAPTGRRRLRSPTRCSPGRPKKRQSDLRGWLQQHQPPQSNDHSSSSGPPHRTAEDAARQTPGRATQGPPT